ncbi:RNA polymerase sigma factor [Flavihumibacter sp. RY-1]|uniref:RNA polymerase sigma factor n=1 Tax=Flavihumibacter fluminis TaxID=2909236 RepID=A0ABS9BDV4_9BACT|nr:RNA polymerase sigma factor [Flavihumibacter fluminis]MCF1713313.1 RNA polymerase sigma factor [Flavihumibacter fluminis]
MKNSNPFLNQQFLAQAFYKGNEQALAILYEEFHPVLSYYAYNILNNRSIAEEIACGAFIKSWKMNWKLDTYGAIRAYLYKIVQRDSIAYLRKERKRSVMHRAAQKPAITTEKAFEKLVRTELYHVLYNALKALSPGNQKVITMYFLEDKNTNEIARELNLHPSTVKTQKSRGLEALRKLLQPIT